MALAAVRPAVPSDVDDIVRIQAGTWRAAYAALVPATAIEQLTGPSTRAAWLGAVGAGAGTCVLVATEGEQAVGFCAAARGERSRPLAAEPEPERPSPGPHHWAEIGTLLVEPRWGRRGHGGRLLAAAAQALRATGARFGMAWVPEADEASRRFYARAGWEPDGPVRVLDTGAGQLREVRLTGSLDLVLV